MADPFANGIDGASVFLDLDAIKAPIDCGEETEEILTKVPVRKPNRKWFVRVHPTYFLPVSLVEDEEASETYFVLPAMRPELADYSKTVTLHVAINRQGQTFLWPVPVSDPSGRQNDWHSTHRAAAEQAKTRWLQMLPDKSQGSYRIKAAKASWPEPEWREETLNELLEIAFKDRIIGNRQHPIVKRYLGLG
jgi:hypothetical protein